MREVESVLVEKSKDLGDVMLAVVKGDEVEVEKLLSTSKVRSPCLVMCSDQLKYTCAHVRECNMCARECDICNDQLKCT